MKNHLKNNILNYKKKLSNFIIKISLYFMIREKT